MQDAEGHPGHLFLHQLDIHWADRSKLSLQQVRSASETAKGRGGVEKSSICRPTIDVLNILLKHGQF